MRDQLVSGRYLAERHLCVIKRRSVVAYLAGCLARVGEHDLYRAGDRIECVHDLPVGLLFGRVRLNGVPGIGVRYSPLVLLMTAESHPELRPAEDIVSARRVGFRPCRVGDGDGVEGVCGEYAGVITGCAAVKERRAARDVTRQIIQVIIDAAAERHAPLALRLIRRRVRPQGVIVLFIGMREDAQVCTHRLRAEAICAVDAFKLGGGDIVPLGARVQVHVDGAYAVPCAVHGKEQLNACGGLFVLLDFLLVGIVVDLLVRVRVIVVRILAGIGIIVVILIRVSVAVAVVALVRVGAAVVAVALIRVGVPVVVVALVRVGVPVAAVALIRIVAAVAAVTLVRIGFAAVAVEQFCIAVLLLHLLGLLSVALSLSHGIDRWINDGEYADQRQQKSHYPQRLAHFMPSTWHNSITPPACHFLSITL